MNLDNEDVDVSKRYWNALEGLFEQLPLDQAMTQLVVRHPVTNEALMAAVEAALSGPPFTDRADLAAGLWLYVDELDRSHSISQGLDEQTGSFWHGIMHRREGDFDNSHYWFNRVGTHPAMKGMDGYDPHRFIDAVKSHSEASEQALVAMQRREWLELFTWCTTR